MRVAFFTQNQNCPSGLQFLLKINKTYENVDLGTKTCFPPYTAVGSLLAKPCAMEVHCDGKCANTAKPGGAALPSSLQY